ncbi:MAG: tyrosine-type recombinase/integrase [Clostridia bacterium]|nr:tyrosine-type recombinase/integrase [Clostridia bacterium]
MATIQKRNDTYQIAVSTGYDLNGKQIRKTMTWKPAPGMTKKQIEKELNRQAVMFEDRAKRGLVLDGSIRFADFAEKWFKEYAEPQLKPKTLAHYRALIPRINQSIGHIPLDKLQPLHLRAFYNELEKEGVRKDQKYKSRFDLKAIRKEKHMKKVELAAATGLSASTLDAAENSHTVSKQTAEKLCAALTLKLPDAFEPVGKTTLSDKTVRSHHTLISSILEKAVRWNILPDNPAKRAEAPKLQRRVPQYLDEAGARDLMKALDHEGEQQQVMIKLLMFFGMRRGELLGLKWSDIDFDRQTITINRTIQYLPEKGVFESSTKTTSSERTLKAAPYTMQILRQFQAWQSAERLKSGDRWQDQGYLFTRYDGQPLRPDYLTSWFKDFVRRNNLPDIHVHSLRHTSATLLIADGTPLTTVAHRLGHANAGTTTKIYAHAIQSADAAAAEALESKLLSGVKSRSQSSLA